MPATTAVTDQSTTIHRLRDQMLIFWNGSSPSTFTGRPRTNERQSRQRRKERSRQWTWRRTRQLSQPLIQGRSRTIKRRTDEFDREIFFHYGRGMAFFFRMVVRFGGIFTRTHSYVSACFPVRRRASMYMSSGSRNSSHFSRKGLDGNSWEYGTVQTDRYTDRQIDRQTDITEGNFEETEREKGERCECKRSIYHIHDESVSIICLNN